MTITALIINDEKKDFIHGMKSFLREKIRYAHICVLIGFKSTLNL